MVMVAMLAFSAMSCPFGSTGTLTVLNLTSQDGYAYGVIEGDTLVRSAESRSFTYYQGRTVGARAGQNHESVLSAGPFETIVLD